MAELARELAELTLELADELDEPRLVHTTHAIHGRTGLARACNSPGSSALAAEVRRVYVSLFGLSDMSLLTRSRLPGVTGRDHNGPRPL